MKYKVKISQEMQELKLQQSTWLVAKLWHVNNSRGEGGNNKKQQTEKLHKYI